jgi:hypothetical protein
MLTDSKGLLAINPSPPLATDCAESATLGETATAASVARKSE